MGGHRAYFARFSRYVANVTAPLVLNQAWLHEEATQKLFNIFRAKGYALYFVGGAVRNALMAPITIIMLHVNWLIGGVVVVEVLFGFPGLGKYIYDAAIFGDFNAVEAAAMLTVTIAIATRLIGDLAYTFLNPRIRYA